MKSYSQTCTKIPHTEEQKWLKVQFYFHVVHGRTWKRNGEEQEQSGGKKEADLSTGTGKKRTKTVKIGSWKFRQVKQAKKGELLWHLDTQGDKRLASGRKQKKNEKGLSKLI